MADMDEMARLPGMDKTHAALDAHLAAGATGDEHVTMLREVAAGAGDSTDTPNTCSAVKVQVWGWSFGSADLVGGGGVQNADPSPPPPAADGGVAAANAAPDEDVEPPTRSIRLGLGLLPRGLERAITTMRKGGRALYRIAARAGFPADGLTAADPNGEAPPPTATPEVQAEWTRWQEAMADDGAVEVEIRLGRYKDPQDILGDGGILKYVSVHGDGPRSAGTVVSATVNVVAGGVTVVDGSAGRVEVPLSEVAVGARVFMLEITDPDAAVGVEIVEETIRQVLGTMRVGERCRVHAVAEYGFGGDGCASLSVPPDAPLDIALELHEVVGEAPKPSEEPPEARIARANELKSAGTTLYKGGDFAAAANMYSQAVARLDQDFLFAEPHRTESRAVKTACSLNIAQCQLKLEQYPDVIGICNAILEKEPECVKAHFRKGKAYQATWEYTAAIECYQMVLKLEPQQPAATASIEQCRKAKKAAHDADRAKYKDMFGKRD
mmetsp:Transcript_23803/g.62294  ORF Transcript_23803/g.62294 Transcript_23803/m.62294 type:complete len:496 (-) Transcript_23803:117-1604(-)